MKRFFAKNFARNYETKIILGTSDAWLMSRLSQQPSNPAYYIEDCQISKSVIWMIPQYLYSFYTTRLSIEEVQCSKNVMQVKVGKTVNVLGRSRNILLFHHPFFYFCIFHVKCIYLKGKKIKAFSIARTPFS